ncbi:MAG: CsbD family protein [Gammaproteobacteria bacterium]|nr:CsbD family protein [Gammaproteobacteria bacterium]
MNWEQIKGNWNQLKGGVKVQWGKLTDDDLLEVEGDRDKLVGKVQEAYGISKEEAARQVDEFKWD